MSFRVQGVSMGTMVVPWQGSNYFLLVKVFIPHCFQIKGGPLSMKEYSSEDTFMSVIGDNNS